MLLILRRFLGRLLSKWVSFWSRLEGPELEPALWHSHYLSSRVSAPHLTALGQELSGLIIDIGAGTGHGAVYLDKARSEYFPTDLPSGSDATDKRISINPKAPVFHCSVYEIPFPDSHFGGAMMLSVLEHLERPNKVLAEVFRVIKQEGLLISTPFAFAIHGAPCDFRRCTLAGMACELQEAGFEIVKTATCGAAFSTLATNFHITLRHHLMSGPPVIKNLIAICLPGILTAQAVINLIALLLDRLDRSGSFPLAIAVLARKPAKEF